MAGLFGFFARVERTAGEMARALQQMAAAASSRPDHESFLDVNGRIAVGGSGPGILGGNLRPHRHPGGSVLYVEGEAYCIEETLGTGAMEDRGWDLVHRSWLKNGDAAVRRLDGLYNFVVYEPRGPRVSLVNDRYGSRRFYVADTGDLFGFASELQPLIALLEGQVTLDRDFIDETICLGSTLGDKTWFREICLLPPATAMTITPDGVTTRRYWHWRELPAPGANAAADRLEQVHALWRRSIDVRLDHRPMGQQLSGGFDSRLILAEIGTRDRDWCAVTYGRAQSDEVRCARLSAEAARCPWLFWPLPGRDAIERRVQLSLATDGLVDLAGTAHQAGLLPWMAQLFRIEMSGYLGDVILGDTYWGTNHERVIWHLGYWSSPISLSHDDVIARIRASIGGDSPWAWLMDTKLRKLINNWPHMAVNDLEVRKPFMDYAFLDFCLGLPEADRRGHRLYRQLFKRYYPRLAAVPEMKSGVAIGAATWQRNVFRLARGGYRHYLQPCAARAGLPLRPWIRQAMEPGAWRGESDAIDEINAALTAPDARVRDYFDPAAIRATLHETWQAHRVGAEIPMGLYRVERYLRHLHDRQLEARCTAARHSFLPSNAIR